MNHFLGSFGYFPWCEYPQPLMGCPRNFRALARLKAKRRRLRLLKRHTSKA
jgi:hypothetical protein